MRKRVPEFEQTKTRGKSILTKKITNHHLIQLVVSFTVFGCQHSRTAVLHDELIKYHGNGLSLGALCSRMEGGTEHSYFFATPRSASNKSSSTVLQASWALKLLLKHDPCHVGDLQDNWFTRDVKRSGWGACTGPYVKADTQAVLISLRLCYWPPSWE